MKINFNSKFYYLIAIIVLSSLAIQAGMENKTIGYYFGYGGVLFNTEKMEDELAAVGYKNPKDWAYAVGAGFYGRKRMVFEAEISGLMWQPRETGIYETKMYGITSSINLGVNVLPIRLPVTLFPFIGAGFGRNHLILNETHIDFNNAVANPPVDLIMTQRNFTLRTGIGYDFSFKRKVKKGKKKLSIGFRAGYLFDVTDNDDWRSDRLEIKMGPEMNTTGFYGQVVIGRSHEASWKKGKGSCSKKSKG